VTVFDSVLIANRGEIALRLVRAVRAAGLRAVAVYSDADRHAPHLREADSAMRIGPAAPAESYLSIPALLDAVERSGAQAVHPGYGFLSENAEFARACAQAGVTFVGPPPEVMERMGRKDEARRLAVATDVPVVSGLDDGGDDSLLAHAEREVGFPLMVKAVAGGGGKGMRVVRRASELEAALASARREGQASFGDARLLVERFIERPRHVEVQILADAHGNVVHLFERDCSVQRRHQKVIEEAPAPTISARTRQELTSSAVRLARQVGYVNAGTVEFMVAGEELFFLEMNTRLQVEHPVTEAITGRDLVSLQLRVAAGERLPFGQGDVQAAGHAIEVRVYAEDPGVGFLPQAGIISTVDWTRRARVDAALEPGQSVSTDYDPMLAKLTVHAATREAARRAMVAALDESAIFGVTTNMAFLRTLVESPEFTAAEIDTDFLDREPAAFLGQPSDPPLVAAAWCSAQRGDEREPFGVGDGWRLGSPPAPVGLDLVANGQHHRVRVDRRRGTVETDGRSWGVRSVASEPGRMSLEVDGNIHAYQVNVDRHAITIGFQGAVHVFKQPEAFGDSDEEAGGDGAVAAPMPGKILEVAHVEGQEVEAGQTVVVMEAMKMELSLQAPIAGRIEKLKARTGDQVARGDVLFVVSVNAGPG